MDMSIVFIHRGYPLYLKWAIAQARSCNYRVLVVGDEVVRAGVDFGAMGAQFHHIDDYMRRALKFHESYKHISVNDTEYELFCFERWYILAELLAEQGGHLLYIDSDILVYPGLSDSALMSAFHGRTFCNTAWFNYVREPEVLEIFLDYLDALYRSPDELLALAERHPVGGRPHVSDMTALMEFHMKAPDRCNDLFTLGATVGFDGNVRGHDGMEMVHGVKKVVFRDGIPFVFPTSGGEQRLYSLHFQGFTKPLMQVMSTLRPEYASTVDDLYHKVEEEEQVHRNKEFCNVAALYRSLYRPI